LVSLRAAIPARHPSAAILGEERMGAGVVISAEHVLTAHYLVLGAGSVEVTGLDGRGRHVDAIALDHDSGLALVTAPLADVPPARLASASEPRPGDPVFLLTATGENERRGASGHVSFVGPFEAFWEYMLDRAIMTTIVNPGLAGGPLLDARGRVVGIVSLGLAAVGRYSLAIPSSLFEARRQLLESGEPMPASERHAWIGFYPQANEDGVQVSGVVADGPAEGAGLQRGDLLVSIDGHPVQTLRQLYHALRRRAPGDRVGMQVLRDEAIHVLEVVAGDRYEFFK
jgi:S1-C subfamily serine protease